MEFSELTALIRALSQLHPQDGIDVDLISSLERLLVARRPVRPVAESSRTYTRDALQHRPDANLDSQTRRDSGEFAKPPSIGGSGGHKEAAHRKEQPEEAKRLEAIESLLQTVAERADLLTDQLHSTTQQQRHKSPEADVHALAPPVDDLFPAGRVRAVLREMGTVPTPSGRPDLYLAVKRIAGGIPIRQMPRFLVNTLPHSIHWLFEAGPSMLPYSRDKQQLARNLHRLMGEDRIRIADFIIDPLKGVRPRGQVKWMPLSWPTPPSAFVVVSDLGEGGKHTIGAIDQEMWRAFLQTANAHGVSTILLNPYQQDRWPQVAHEFDSALTWEAGSGVQALRRTQRIARNHRWRE